MIEKMPSKAHANYQERRRGVRAMSDLMPGLGQAAFRRFGFIQNAIVTRWAEIVGPSYARFSAPESLSFPRGERYGATLRLVVEGAFATTIQHAGPEIVERVNRFFGYGAVARIAIRQAPMPRKSWPQPPEPAAQVPENLAGSLKTIHDPGLKAALEALARRVATSTGPPVFD